jgi:DNA invertase Pin-like site-specific DNA recombinase
MMFGYARVSTDKQDTALQMDALAAHGVANDNIYTDVMSGGRDDRPGLLAVIEKLGSGDTLTVYRVDRASRSARHLLDTIDRIEAKGANFKSLTEPFDLAAPEGRFMFTLLAGFAEWERNIIRRRTRDGLAAAKARGVVLGRKFTFPEGSEGWVRVRDKIIRGIPGHIIAREEKCSEATLYKAFPGGRRALLAAMRTV